MNNPLAPVLVDCERHSMRLTAPACVRLWHSANPEAPPAWEGRAACHSCPQGAARAGVAFDPMAAARDAVRPVCPRCVRFANRMVGGGLCVSCYNRERELRIGKNGRGAFPRWIALAVGPTRFAVRIAGGFDVIGIVSSGAAEVAIRQVRKATMPVFVGVAPFNPESIAA